MPIVQHALAFEGLNLEEVHNAVAILHIVTDELGNVPVLLYLEIVLAEESVYILGHLLGLFKRRWTAIHHCQVVYVVCSADECSLQIAIGGGLLQTAVIIVEVEPRK